MKIQIIGFSGSGKSSLAKDLAARYHLPVVFLDTVFWLPGWVMRPREEQSEILGEFLEQHPDGWVIDGNYTKNHYDERMEAADLILFLNYNRFLCLYRILKRNLMYRGKTRESMTVGCDEKIDWPFIKYSFWESRTKKARERFRHLQALYPDKFVVLSSPRALKKFLQTLPDA